MKEKYVIKPSKLESHLKVYHADGRYIGEFTKEQIKLLFK